MNVGEQAYILIPSGRAYGKGILNYNYQYVMPPYATLVYEIKISDRKPNAKQRLVYEYLSGKHLGACRGLGERSGGSATF